MYIPISSFFALEPSTSQSCNRVLAVVRGVRDRIRGDRIRGYDEHRANFAPYDSRRKGKKRAFALSQPSSKKNMWCTRFVCLASKDTTRVPCTVAEKEVLVQAGLGEKEIEIADVDCSHQAFHEQLVEAFPKLASSGGFELLRCVANSRLLEPISSSIAISPKLLKSVIGKGRLFIRPIQRNLDVDTCEECSSTQVFRNSDLFFP